jgi:hypothetical protein
MADADSTHIDIDAVYAAAEARCEQLRDEVAAIEAEILDVKGMARDIRFRIKEAGALGERRVRLEARLFEHVAELNRLRGELVSAQSARPIAMRRLPRLTVRPSEVAAAAMAIVQQAAPVAQMSDCGVYFLVQDDRIVYVGQSIEVSGRVLTHFRDGLKQFTHAAVLLCAPERLDELEMFWIRALRPEYNRSGILRCSPEEVELEAVAAIADLLFD